MKFHLTLIILTVITLNSCAVIEESVHSNDYSILDSTLQALNGTYSNKASQFNIKEYRGSSFHNEENYLLWNVFDFHKKKHCEIKDNCEVQIVFTSKNTAELRLLYNDSILDNRKIRGEFRNGFFYKKPSVWLIPFFPIMFSCNSSRYRIGIDQNRNLIIQESWCNTAFMVVAGYSSKAQVIAIYDRT